MVTIKMEQESTNILLARSDLPLAEAKKKATVRILVNTFLMYDTKLNTCGQSTGRVFFGSTR